MVCSNTVAPLAPKAGRLSPHYPLPPPEILFGSLTPMGSAPSGNGPFYIPEGAGYSATLPITPNLAGHPAATLTAPVPHSLPPIVPELPPMPILTYPESQPMPEAFQEELLPIEEIITPRPYRGNGKYLAANPGNYTGMYQTVNSPAFPFPKDLSR